MRTNASNHIQPALHTARLITLAFLAITGFGMAAPVGNTSTSSTTPAATAAAALELTIPAIQGRGTRSAHIGRRVVTSGIVTVTMRHGFWLQDAAGDGDPSTSDGLFVHVSPQPAEAVPVADQPSAASPSNITIRQLAPAAGNRVRVTGRVVEYDTGSNVPDSTVTQLTAVESVTSLGPGESIRPIDLGLPTSTESELERVEGMLVTLRAPALTINQNHFQARYGQLTLGAAGRLLAPTERHRPGSTAAAAQASSNALHRIVLDDASSSQHPVPTPHLDPTTRLPRTGDRVGPVTGVIDHGLTTHANPGPGGWRIHPAATPVFSVANPRLHRPPAVGGTLRIAGFGLQNYFTTFQDGTTADGATRAGCRVGTRRAASLCRGADNRAEFDRQQGKIIAALVGLDADAIGLTEIQNDGNRSAEHLAEALNARVGAGTYASVSLPTEGTGSDAIRVALLYKRSALRPIGPAVSDVDPVHHRPPLSQAFEHGGKRFVLLVSHFKSRRGCPAAGESDARGDLDAGDGQGCWNARRLAQAQRLRSFSAERQAAAKTDLALLIGDLNAYSREDPVDALTRAGAVDLVARHDSNGYTHVFDGAAGRLDHAIATPALAAHVTGAVVWHINADEPVLLDYNLELKGSASNCGAGRACPADLFRPDAFRSSDHDPVLVGIDLGARKPQSRDRRRGAL